MTDAERATYEGYLKEAEKALHTMMIGGKPRVVVEQNGERVEFFASDARKLRAYIMELKGLLGMPLGISGPMTVSVL